jgi:hypothetical protein
MGGIVLSLYDKYELIYKNYLLIIDIAQKRGCTIGVMKRRPSPKRRATSSGDTHALDQYRSAALEPARAPRRKQIDRRSVEPVEGPTALDWADPAADLVGQQPRR